MPEIADRGRVVLDVERYVEIGWEQHPLASKESGDLVVDDSHHGVLAVAERLFTNGLGGDSRVREGRGHGWEARAVTCVAGGQQRAASGNIRLLEWANDYFGQGSPPFRLACYKSGSDGE